MIFMVKMFYKIDVILGKYDITLLTPYVEQLGNWSNDAQRTCPFSILSDLLDKACEVTCGMSSQNLVLYWNLAKRY